MTPEELLTRLSALLPAQFEDVLFRVDAPSGYLSGPNAPQTIRAIELIGYLKQQRRLDELAHVVQQVSARPAPSASTQRAGIDFSAERARHARFMGREALLARLDQLLIDEPADRWVVVTGGPGMGKSALLAQWLARREAAGALVPHHFIRRGEYDWDDPGKLAGSLVAQIAALFPAHSEPESDARMHPAARLQSTLQRVSQHELVPQGQRLVVLIDGLDEYDPPPDARASGPGRDPLAAFLPSTLPRGVSVLCASRPRHPYVDQLVARGALQIDLDAPTFADDNAATVRAFWEQAAPELGLDAAFVAAAVERAGGNPQHAEMLRKHLAGLLPEQRQVEDIPRGLDAQIASAWERIATDRSVVDGLGILCAAREPLTLDELGRVARWTSAASRQAFMRSAREWLIETRRTDRTAEYRLHHDSIRGHVAEAIGSDALAAHHRALAEHLAGWPASSDASARRYALHHALWHRAEAGDWADAWRVAANVAFLEAKCREVGVHDTEADVARTVERCRVSGDELHGKRFADLARALGRESRWLHEAPDATAALIWNRLRRYGWTVSDLDAQLRMPRIFDMLRVRNVATRESPALVRNLEGHSKWVTDCAVTPDGRYVVSASWDKTLKVWELASGRAVATLEGHTDNLQACAVTPDGRRVVSASWDETIRVWELASGGVVTTFRGYTGIMKGCAVTPDGRHVVLISEDETLNIHKLASGRRAKTLKGHSHGVMTCAVTPDGRYVVSALSWEQPLKVWELAKGRAVATLEGDTHLVTACAVTPDGRYVVLALVEKTLGVWELPSGRALATLEGHSDWVSACAVTPDGRHVVSASHDQTLKVWELTSGRTVATLEGHTGNVTACAVTPDGRHVVSASEDDTLKVWELTSRRTKATSEGHTSSVMECMVTSDSRYAVSASLDGTLKVWEPASGDAVATIDDDFHIVTACAVTPDGQHVVSASFDNTVKVRELASGRVAATIEGPAAKVEACAMTPDGRHVVSASEDGTLKVWELASGRLVVNLEGHSGSVRACAVTPDGLHVVSASEDRTLKIWELASGRVVATLEGHTFRLWDCAVTPDGRHVVSASGDCTVKIWELASARAVATLKGHSASVIGCAVTPDGRHVVSASSDRTIRVWDIASHLCRLVHHGDIAYLAIAVTATTIIAGDRSGAVWFFDLPPSMESELATRRGPE